MSLRSFNLLHWIHPVPFVQISLVEKGPSLGLSNFEGSPPFCVDYLSYLIILIHLRSFFGPVCLLFAVCNFNALSNLRVDFSIIRRRRCSVVQLIKIKRKIIIIFCYSVAANLCVVRLATSCIIHTYTQQHNE